MKSVTILKAISNNTKLRIVSLLLEHELCVCELEAILNIKQATISRNLSRLKESGIVEVRREKQRGFYYLTDWFMSQTQFVEYIKTRRFEEPILQHDYEAFVEHETIRDKQVYVCNAFKDVS